MGQPAVYQVTVAAPYAGSVQESLNEAVAEKGATSGFRLEEGDPNAAPSEIQFDPITLGVGLYVGNLILEAVADITIESVIRKLVAKVKAKSKAFTDTSTAAAPAKLPAPMIVVYLPDFSVVQIDLSDDQSVEIQLRKLAKKPS